MQRATTFPIAATALATAMQVEPKLKIVQAADFRDLLRNQSTVYAMHVSVHDTQITGDGAISAWQRSASLARDGAHLSIHTSSCSM